MFKNLKNKGGKTTVGKISEWLLSGFLTAIFISTIVWAGTHSLGVADGDSVQLFSTSTSCSVNQMLNLSSGIISCDDSPVGTVSSTSIPQATYITQTGNENLDNEQALSNLAGGILKSDGATGVISIATAGTDYVSTETEPTLTDDTDVTIGDGSSGDVNLYFDGDGGTDGNLYWDVSDDKFVIDQQFAISDSSDQFRFIDSDNVNNYVDIGTNDSGSTCNYTINPHPDTNEHVSVAYFRTTNTGGSLSVNYHLGDGTDSKDARIGIAQDSFFNLTGGDVGIGTSTPSTKLDVSGTVTATGLTSTGTVDFSGATTQKIRDETDCSSETSESEICWDSDDDKLYVGNGASATEIGSGGSGSSNAPIFSQTVEVPTDDDKFYVLKAKEALTLADIFCVIDPTDTGESVVINVMECDSSADNCVTVDATISCDNDGAMDDGSLSNGSIDANDWIALDIGAVSGTVSQLTVTAYE